jgi:hypothetical protein
MRDLYSVLKLSRRASSKDIKAGRSRNSFHQGLGGSAAAGVGMNFLPPQGCGTVGPYRNRALEIAVAAAR